MSAAKGYGVPARRTEPLRLTMHPDAPSHGAYRAWMRASERPIAIDLFSGAGGLSYGLESAGYRVASQLTWTRGRWRPMRTTSRASP